MGRVYWSLHSFPFYLFWSDQLVLNNGLLVGLATDAISTLQLIRCTRINKHIARVLMGLHWVPVQQRIQYRILLAYKAQHGLAPGYMSELLQRYQPSCTLRSATERLRLIAQSCNIMGRACLQQGCPCVVECASSLYQMCWLPEFNQIHAQISPLPVRILLCNIVLAHLRWTLSFLKYFVISEGHTID